MPALLVGSTKEIEPLRWQTIKAKLEAMDENNWATLRDELLTRLPLGSKAPVIQVEGIPA